VARYSDVCVLVPVLNELGNIGRLLDGIREALHGRDYVVCFIDDGSTDGTVELIQSAMEQPDSRVHLIRRRKTLLGSERGGALFAGMMWGLQETSCRTFVEMDGDLSHRPEELGTGLSLVESGRADVAVASKYVPGSVVTNRTLARNLISLTCSAAVRLFLSHRIRDYSNGYRFYTREAASLVAETRIVYASPIYLSEVMAIWISRKLRVVEFPTHYVGRNEGLSKLRPIDLIKASIAVFEIAVRLHVLGFSCVTHSRLSQSAGTSGRSTIGPAKPTPRLFLFSRLQPRRGRGGVESSSLGARDSEVGESTATASEG